MVINYLSRGRYAALTKYIQKLPTGMSNYKARAVLGAMSTWEETTTLKEAREYLHTVLDVPLDSPVITKLRFIKGEFTYDAKEIGVRNYFQVERYKVPPGTIVPTSVIIDWIKAKGFTPKKYTSPFKGMSDERVKRLAETGRFTEMEDESLDNEIKQMAFAIQKTWEKKGYTSKMKAIYDSDRNMINWVNKYDETGEYTYTNEEAKDILARHGNPKIRRNDPRWA